jgi:hypothetical protein
MKYFILRSLVVFAMLIGMANASLALSACPSSGYFDNCYGTYIWANGEKYVCEWQNDKMHGMGAATLINGNKYVG